MIGERIQAVGGDTWIFIIDTGISGERRVQRLFQVAGEREADVGRAGRR